MPYGETTDPVTERIATEIVVEGKVIIEAKAVEKIIPVHEAQILTYLKLSQRRLGFLINFKSKLIKDGIKRMIR